MSLVKTRLALTHLCSTERNANLNTLDEWNQPLPPDWIPNLTDVQCRAWIASHDTVTNKATLAVVIEVRLIVPLGTDIADDDRVTTISWRGDTYIDGPLIVHALLRRRDYLEVILAKAQ